MESKTEEKKKRMEPVGYISKDTTREKYVPPETKVVDGFVHGLPIGLHSYELRNMHGVPVRSSMKVLFGTGVDLNQWKDEVGKGYSVYADSLVCAHLDRDIWKGD